MGLTATITLKGPLFERSIPSVARNAVIDEIHKKVAERTKTSGKRLGGQRNTITTKLSVEETASGFEDIVLDIISTTIWPRTTGKTWKSKQYAIIRSMIPRVSRKTVERIAKELGGG